VTRVVLVPGVLALLPEYAGIEDPVAELRAACLAAVDWLGEEVEVLADPQGKRVAESLLDAAEVTRQAPARLPSPTGGLLVVGNGSARRSEKAPGHLDPRSAAFDAGLRAWLGGSGSLDAGLDLGLDLELGAELLASLEGLRLMAERLGSWGEPRVDYDDDPFGVQYWVMRWEVP
jgi:hypothetical protein